MGCFPLDNKKYAAKDLGSWFCARTRGVFSGNNHYATRANGNLSVTVSPGLIWLKMSEFWGVIVLNEEAKVLTSDVADGSLTRWDAVCVRVDKNKNTHEIVLKKGPLGVNPPYPQLVQNDLNYDEVFVAVIKRRPGATSILATDIVDLRMNETYCGLVRDGITGIPTQQLYDAWWAWFSQLKGDAETQANTFMNWMASFRSTNETEFNVWLENFKTTRSSEFESWYTSFTGTMTSRTNAWYDHFTTTTEADILEWFEALQDTIDENAAVNLFNKIDHHEKLSVYKNPVHGMRYTDGTLYVYNGSGWESAFGGDAGLSFDYMDALGRTCNEWEAAGYTWDEFELLKESKPNEVGTWQAFDSRAASVEQLDVAMLPWSAYDAGSAGLTTGPSAETDILKLSQWLPTDIPQMEDFNRDNTRIDAGLKTHADNTSHITAAERTKWNAKLDASKVKQATGSSTTDVMSQKAVTDALGAAGGGDMMKNLYASGSKSAQGYVDKAVMADSATTATKLNGQAASYYASAATVTALETRLAALESLLTDAWNIKNQ